MLNHVRGLVVRARQLAPERGGAVALAAVAVLGLGGLGWLGREISASNPSDASPSLLELLEQVGAPRSGSSAPAATPSLNARPAPTPPAHDRWVSPLKRQCTADPALSRRLEAKVAALPLEMERLTIDPTNYGSRFRSDAFGNPVDPTPRVVVLHETVYGMQSAVQTFLTPHPRDEDQVSYHLMIGENGQVVQALDPAYRAFGAGNSAFNGQWVMTNPDVGGSVNNFALHLSLETPLDGEDADAEHSGYSNAQYDALAVVLTDWMRRFGIAPQNITTHRYVDLGGERADPRSFRWSELQTRLAALGMLCKSG
ncbi:N-acetylmuramoyl-L-alanine amidase [Synechococcus sp. MW101C3]|jgi:N-acetylmuramoyl-L-alanine amidase|uniref:N-acetylmuramoyl-L-alanine amidase n=1 Tax=Synechococcus sp. MW101C3 TaxID=210768 RepID=UPI000B995E39|nr:peptidoglycan recognition family protein [Synechococcus sp. MW101C3]